MMPQSQSLSTLRRDFLRIGSLLPFGLMATHPRVTIGEERSRLATAKSCILLWLDGGPSHLEMWDPKVDVPAEVRGPFRSIPTRIPGIHFSEELKQCAGLADRMTIVRSMTSPLGEHGLANQYLLTGYSPSPSLEYPSLGALVSRQRNADFGALPCYVAMPEIRTGMGAGAMGVDAEPFLVRAKGEGKGLVARDLDFYPGLNAQRLQRRREMLLRIEEQFRSQHGDRLAPNTPFEAAFRMLASDAARRAFDLNEESEAVRTRYGARIFGQGCLLARRLVERDVPFVTVVQTGWDTHENLVLQLRDGYTGAKEGVGLIPTFDQGASALIADLEERGLLDQTLVIAMGEFGRTPKLNPRGGRDHWPRVFSIMMCGGGLPKGVVLGESDRVGESPKQDPITPADLFHTVCLRLGIDPNSSWTSPDGRPVPINTHGKPIHALL
jgi:hypothetical protein